MKIILKCFVLFFCTNILGCSMTVANKWSSIPATDEDQILHQCVQELHKVKPPPDMENITNEEWNKKRLDAMNWLAKCMGNKRKLIQKNRADAQMNFINI